jgi:hypothetical protein
LPATAFLTGNTRSVLLAADRDTPGTFYIYVPDAGVYRSTNKGETFSPYVSFKPGTSSFRYLLQSVQGNPGDLILISRWGGGTGKINYSTGGSAFVDFSRGQIKAVIHTGIGKTMPGGTYPTVFVYGTKVADGVRGFYRSIDKGATWTRFGLPTDIPAVHSMDSPQALIGSWNIPGKCYLVFNGTGACQFA